jgi:hypothetical protein
VAALIESSRGSTLRIALAVSALCAAIALCATAPAHAAIESVKEGAQTVEVGVQSRQPAAVQVAPLQYHGGPVDPASYTYAIYWDPVGEYHNDWMTLIDGYLHDVGADSGTLGNVFSLNGQYTGPGETRASYKSTFRGAYTDTFPYPKIERCVEPAGKQVCLTDAQIRTELKRFIESEHLPTGREVIYFVLTPPGVTVCLDAGGTGHCSDSSHEAEEEANDEEGPATAANGICGYHGAIEPSSETPIVYGVQPWVAGHAGHVLALVPVKTLLPTGAALACQNRELLVEPNQVTSFPHPSSYETGLADLIVNGLSLEQNDIVVDPLMNGWYQTATGAEQADVCRGEFNPVSEKELPKPPETTHALSISNETIDGHQYYLQWGFSSVGATSGRGIQCWQGTELDPHFTATNPVKGGDLVAFDANESGIALDANVTELKLDEPYTAPLYKWEFGDGTSVGPAVQASILHSYQYAGGYPVTLTVTDSAGNVATYTQTIPVSGPPRPAPETTPGVTPPTAGGTATPTLTPAGTGGATPPTVAGPVLTQSALSRSLSKVANLGLAVHYQVNEQVAGQVEALLPASTAARLGIKARPAHGLPAGYPRSVIVGSAVLVTTKGGQGNVRIRFAKATAKKLAKAHRLTLTLRFVLHSASRPPRVATTLSTVVLSK